MHLPIGRALTSPQSRACFVGLLIASMAWPANADDYFIETDDYVENQEITGTFLKEEDYMIMIESLERNGASFDWGWARTPGWGEAPPAAEEPQGRLEKVLGRFKRSGPRTIQEPHELDFDIAGYSTVFLETPLNSVGLIEDTLIPSIHETFTDAMKELGLRPVGSRDQADLELGLAIVDINGFIELELRLREYRTGRNLLLVRHQSHREAHGAAARRYANTLIRFLR